jgi:amidase
VTVPLGTMDDIGMPVGLTFAGRAYDDAALLALGPRSRRSRRAARPPTSRAPHKTSTPEGDAR